jgi:hypothetical protein
MTAGVGCACRSAATNCGAAALKPAGAQRHHSSKTPRNAVQPEHSACASHSPICARPPSVSHSPPIARTNHDSQFSRIGALSLALYSSAISRASAASTTRRNADDVQGLPWTRNRPTQAPSSQDPSGHTALHAWAGEVWGVLRFQTRAKAVAARLIREADVKH